MSKIYVHTPVAKLLQDFQSHLDHNNGGEKGDEAREDTVETGQEALDYSALILSPIEETRSFRQVFPLFIKKLSRKFKTLMKKKGMESNVTWAWDEDLVIVLESLEDFLNLKWKVSFLSSQEVMESQIEDFKSPMVSIGIQEDIYVSFLLLTEKQENTFGFSELQDAIENADGKEEDVPLVVEEIDRDNTEKDKEDERKRREEDEKRAAAEFAKLKEKLDTEVENMKKLQEVLKTRDAMSLGETILKSVSLVKTNKREQAIYLTEKRIEASVLLSIAYLDNEDGMKVKKLLTPLISVAKKGPVDTYINGEWSSIGLVVVLLFYAV